MHGIADFRSDKVAKPTKEMLDAMLSAEWGSGIGDEGPTVREIEKLACELTGKEAAIFVASGTMANAIAIKAQAAPGEQVIADDNSHIVWVEAGNAAYLSQVQMRPLPSSSGVMDIADIGRAMARSWAPTTLICIENTHNMLGGKVMPLDYMRELKVFANARGARVHLDGARITNASVKTGIPVAQYAACADSIMFCLSKGLCAPVGSMLCGDAAFVQKASAFRKRFGGIPKQNAPLAACGIVALTKMIPRLKDDHATASRLGSGLKAIPGIGRRLDVEDAETNMVFVTVKGVDPVAVAAKLAEERVLTLHITGGRLRFVTHRDVDAEDVDRCVGAMQRALGL
jgi:threonine aldolase